MSEQKQGASTANIVRTADGIIGKFHQRELFTVLSIFVMVIGVLVTSALPAFVGSMVGWVFLLLLPLYVLAAMCVRAFMRKEWRVLGLSLNQVALVSSIVAAVFIVPLTLFDVFPLAQFLPSGTVAGFVFAVIGALGYLFFAAVAPFLAPFKAEFTPGPEAAEEQIAPIARKSVAPTLNIAPVKDAGVPNAGWSSSPGAEGSASSVPSAGVAASTGQADDAAPLIPAANAEPATSTMTTAQTAPAVAEPAVQEGRSLQETPVQEIPVEQEKTAVYERPAVQEVPVEEQSVESRVTEIPQEKQMAFWFAVPETRDIVDPKTEQPVAQLEPGNWILALEDQGTSFLVSTESGQTGVLKDISDVERA